MAHDENLFWIEADMLRFLTARNVHIEKKAPSYKRRITELKNF